MNVAVMMSQVGKGRCFVKDPSSRLPPESRTTPSPFFSPPPFLPWPWKVLQGLASGPQPTLAYVSEDLLLALVEFTTVFLEEHLGRVLHIPDLPLNNLLTLLATFTFKLPTARLLRRAMLPWTTLTERLTAGEEGG